MARFGVRVDSKQGRWLGRGGGGFGRPPATIFQFHLANLSTLLGIYWLRTKQRWSGRWTYPSPTPRYAHEQPRPCQESARVFRLGPRNHRDKAALFSPGMPGARYVNILYYIVSLCKVLHDTIRIIGDRQHQKESNIKELMKAVNWKIHEHH
jgi:hypothetical protein